DYQRTRHALGLYQGDTRLAQVTGTTRIEADAPGTGKLPYRLVLEADRDATVSPYSSRTHTEWGFTSRLPSGNESAVLPLLQLTYGIDTDTAGRADRGATVAVSAVHLPGAAGAGATVFPVTMEVSYDDGRTWRQARPGHDGRFKPAGPRKAQFVSLRAHAKDSAGNTITQSVIRAFGLR
ncbi:peptidase, partial [Streptomyces sp. NPDC001858]